MSPGLGSYVEGSAGLIGIVAALLWGGHWLRRWIAPALSGATARLGEIVLALSLLVVTLEALGSFGLLKREWVVASCVAVGGAATLLGRWRCRRDVVPEAAPTVPAWALLVAVAVASIAVAQWSSPSLLSVGQGIFGGDATWYHLPFAARFAQSHSTWQLHLTDPLRLTAWFYPAGSELLHSVGILLYRSDWTSPLINLGWLALGMLGGYCVGRPYGVGPATLVASALPLASGVMLDSQAGDAGNDAMAVALMLAMAALLVNGCAAGVPERDRTAERGTLALAGLAGGLAVSVKLTMLAPVGVIALGAVLLAARGTRTASAGILAATAALTGGYWYLRNFAHGGNPLPQAGAAGPLGLPHPDQMALFPRDPHSVAHFLHGHPGVFRAWILPDLGEAFGPLYWLVLGLAALGALSAIVLSRNRVLAVLGAAAIATAVVYLFLPLSAAGSGDAPHGFYSNLRYLVPALALGLVVVPLAPPLRRPVVREATLVLLAALCAVTTLTPAPWYSSYTAGAVLIAAALVGVPVAVDVLRRRPLGLAVAVLLAGSVLALTLTLGRGQEIRHSRVNYTMSALKKRATRNSLQTFAWARDLSHRRIAIAGSGELFFAQYLFYGADSTNRVQYIGEPGPHGAYRVPSGCAALRRQINRGDFDFLVISQWGDDADDRERFPIRAWVKRDPALEQIRVEDARPQPVWTYRVGGRLGPGACRS